MKKLYTKYQDQIKKFIFYIVNHLESKNKLSSPYYAYLDNIHIEVTKRLDTTNPKLYAKYLVHINKKLTPWSDENTYSFTIILELKSIYSYDNSEFTILSDKSLTLKYKYCSSVSNERPSLLEMRALVNDILGFVK